MAGVAQLEDVVTRLVADARPWSAGFKAARGELGAFQRTTGSALGAIQGQLARIGPALAGAFSVGAIVAFARQAVEAADAVGDLAEAAGLSVETFQRYQQALSFSNVGASEYASAMTTATRATGAFLAGQSRAVEAFKLLGISAGDARIALMSQDEVLRLLIDRLGSYGSRAERALAASRLFGESVGPKLVAFAEQGGAKIDELLAQSRVFTEEQTRLAAQANDAWGKLANTIGVELHAAFLAVIKATGQFVDGFDLVEVNREIAETTVALEKMRRQAELPGPMGEGNRGLQERIKAEEARLKELEEARAARLKEQRENTPEERSKRAAEEKAVRDARESAEREAAARADVQKGVERDLERARKEQRDRELRDAEDKVEQRRKAAEIELELERKVFEQQQKRREEAAEQIREAQRGFAETMVDLATNGEEAWDRLKQKILTNIAELALEWARSGIGQPGQPGQGGGAPSAGGGLGDIFRSIFGSGGTTPTFARGGSPWVGRASIVGESGPEWFVPRTAGSVVPMDRAGAGGGRSGDVRIELPPIEVSVQPGMSVAQQRRRGLDGQERMRIAVRTAAEDDISRGGPLSRAIAAETGTRRTPRRGIA